MLIFLFLQIPVSFRIQVKDVNGKWIPGTPIPNTIMVNTGDLLQFWTNGFYPATVNHAMSIFQEIFTNKYFLLHSHFLCSSLLNQLHRVVIPEKEIQKRVPRYSFAYFFAPDDDTVITTLNSPYIVLKLDNEKNQEKSHITAYEHIISRSKSAFQY